MTTFQDPPPQSRRAVRQSERGEAPSQTPADGTPYAFDAAQQGDAQPVDAQAAQPSAPDAPHHSGRRAQLPPQTDQGFASGEPLTYSTQGRISPPVDEQSQQQPLAAAPPPGSPDQPYRVRDFSPEGGRRAAPRDPMADSPLSSAASFPAPARPVELDYQTQGVAPTPSHSAASVPVEDTMNHTLSRRELREMRAAAEQKAPPLQLPPAVLPEPIDTLLNSGPIDIPTLAPPPGQSQALAEAMAEFDMLTRSRREAEARARDAQVASLATPIIPTQQQPVAQPAAPVASVPQAPVVQPSAPVASAPVPSAPVASAPVASAPVASPSAPAPVASAPVFEPSAPAPSAPAPQLFFPPMAEEPSSVQPAPPAVAHTDFVQPSVPQPSSPESPVLESPMLVTPVFMEPTAPAAHVAPASPDPASADRTAEIDPDTHGGRSPRASNHWRVQAAMEDDELPYENTLSRTVGSNTSAITTSALVLPSVPQPDSMLGSLTSTGEILVTGSINLPRSLGSTGAHPDRVDNSDYEEDPFDSQVAAPDSAPVRAIRAISSNTSTRAVIETKKPQGNRMLTAVIVVGAVLVVALLGFVIYGLANGKF